MEVEGAVHAAALVADAALGAGGAFAEEFVVQGWGYHGFAVAAVGGVYKGDVGGVRVLADATAVDVCVLPRTDIVSVNQHPVRLQPTIIIITIAILFTRTHTILHLIPRRTTRTATLPIHRLDHPPSPLLTLIAPRRTTPTPCRTLQTLQFNFILIILLGIILRLTHTVTAVVVIPKFTDTDVHFHGTVVLELPAGAAGHAAQVDADRAVGRAAVVGRRVHLDEPVLADAGAVLVAVDPVVALKAEQALECGDLARAGGWARALGAG